MTDTLFTWNDSFLIGIEELDHEHKALIEDINKLHNELSGHCDQSKIEECLGEIYSRMHAHFALEENVMKEHEYPFFEEHKREHDKLLDSYTESMMRFLNNAGNSSSHSFEDNLKHWVVHHIVTSDKKMSLMIQEKAALNSKP